jgi:hypothetical protein
LKNLVAALTRAVWMPSATVSSATMPAAVSFLSHCVELAATLIALSVEIGIRLLYGRMIFRSVLPAGHRAGILPSIAPIGRALSRRPQRGERCPAYL